VDFDHVSGIGSSLTTEALMVSHDGIAGRWRDVRPLSKLPAEPAPDAESNLARWSADVRASVFAFDLLEPYTFVPNGDTAKLMVWANKDAATRTELVTITRPDETIFADQLQFVRNYADLRADRSAEILAQMNDITSFAGSIGLLHPERTAKTMELLAVLLDVTSIIVLRFKHALASRRPSEYSAQVQPIIQTPAHSAFPHGHATQAFMQAYVLSELVRHADTAAYGDNRLWRTMLRRQAIRISINRIVAGVHFPVDAAAGAVLGIALARHFVRRMGDDGEPAASLTFNDYRGEGDVEWTPLLDKIWSGATDGSAWKYVSAPQALNPQPTHAPSLSWLWNEAKSEWPEAPPKQSEAAMASAERREQATSA
jgi:hypothetical protein